MAHWLQIPQIFTIAISYCSPAIGPFFLSYLTDEKTEAHTCVRTAGLWRGPPGSRPHTRSPHTTLGEFGRPSTFHSINGPSADVSSESPGARSAGPDSTTWGSEITSHRLLVCSSVTYRPLGVLAVPAWTLGSPRLQKVRYPQPSVFSYPGLEAPADLGHRVLPGPHVGSGMQSNLWEQSLHHEFRSGKRVPTLVSSQCPRRQRCLLLSESSPPPSAGAPCSTLWLLCFPS